MRRLESLSNLSLHRIHSTRVGESTDDFRVQKAPARAKARRTVRSTRFSSVRRELRRTRRQKGGKRERVWVQRSSPVVRGSLVLRVRDGEQQRVRVVRGEIGQSRREREKSDDENGRWHGFGAKFIFNDVFSEMLLAVSSNERVDVGDIDERFDDHERRRQNEE